MGCESFAPIHEIGNASVSVANRFVREGFNEGYGFVYVARQEFNGAVNRSLFPASPLPDSEIRLTEEERRTFHRWETSSIGPIFLLLPLFTYAWYFVLKSAADPLVPTISGTLFLVRPMPLVWLLPAMLLGLISTVIPTEWLYQWLLGNRYRRFERASMERVGYDSRPILSRLSTIIIAGSAAFFVADVKTFACFHEDGILIGRPLSLRTTNYQYNRVKSIEHRATVTALSGKIIDRPHYVVFFDDGFTWDTHRGFRDPVPEVDAEIIKFIAQRSGRRIVERP